MAPQTDHLIDELQRRRVDIAELKRIQDAFARRRGRTRTRAAVAFVGGALGMVTLSAVVPGVDAQGTSITGCVVAGTNYLKIAAACAAGEKEISIATTGSAKTAGTTIRAPF
jgi:hypothetical protein